ncbi:MAG: type II secretion system protein [Rhodocyclales bacterium]|nr:type II secretion system protein [Rhodocyclales bacterium]
MNPAVLRRLTSARGFTLTEMAVVLVIVALLIASLVIPLSAQQDIRARQETEKALADIREALLGYAASHAAGDGKPYLPCPDTDDDGLENRTAGACTGGIQEGRLPWADLGLGRNDAWNNRFRYRVTAAFSNSTAGFTLASAGNLTVCADSACAATIAGNVPAVVLSHGANGAGAFNLSGGTNPAPTDANELENTDSDDTLVSRTSDAGFDDLVTWVPPTVLMNRMITTGKLP